MYSILNLYGRHNILLGLLIQNISSYRSILSLKRLIMMAWQFEEVSEHTFKFMVFMLINK